jgi:Chaperone of endosialidase
MSRDFTLDKQAKLLRDSGAMKTTIRAILMAMTSLYLATGDQISQAVLPPPDGGYPGFNTAEGQNALFSLTTGSANTAVGWFSLFSDTDGSFNTATGAGALLFNISDQNTAFGAAALLFNTFGFGNTAVGTAALLNTTGGTVDAPNGGPGSGNTAVGVSALSSNTTGGFSTAVGSYALVNNTGFGNTALGSGAGAGVTNANNVIVIGEPGANVNNSCFIGNIYSNVQPIVGTDPDSVTITSTGRLGRGNVSSRRYKHDIELMDKASESLYALKPVTFRYNKEYDATQTLAFGLIAEEVAEVYPDLVGRNSTGEPESVRYEQINAMLLNEFLKEHRRGEEQDCKIQEQENTIAELRSEIRSLAAMVNEQASELRKVNAQLQISNFARMIAENP